MDPTEDGGQRRFGADVGDGVAHSQVGAHGAVEGAVEDAEDVGRGPADVHADHVDPLLFGDPLQDVPHRPRGGHDGGVGPLDQPVVAGSMRHDVFQKEVMDLVPGPDPDSPVPGPDAGWERRRAGPTRRRSAPPAAPRPGSPPKITGIRYSAPKRGWGRAGAMSSAICTTCRVVPPSVPPEISTMSGRSSRIRWICSWGRRRSLEARTSMTMAPAPRAARLALAAVISRTTPATIIWRPPPALGSGDVKIAPFTAGSGPQDPAGVVDEAAAGHFGHLRDGVHDPQGHVGRRFLHRSGSLAPVGLPVLSVQLPDEDGLGGGAPAVGGQDHVDGFGIDLLHLPAESSSSIRRQR